MSLAWVTGAGGLIGSCLVRVAAEYAPGWKVRGLTRAQLDLCDRNAVRRAFEADRPDVVIHCAALSKSPECEANPAQAWRGNVEVTEQLAELTAECRLIFFSTDLVFDGQDGAYNESAAVNPLSVYARTKVAAEQVVLANPRHTVVRTSLNAGRSPTGDRSFHEQLRLAWQRGEKTRLFVDEFRCPLLARKTAEVTWGIVARDLFGLYHVAGREKLSRWQIGLLLASAWGVESLIEPGSIRDYSGPPRAPDTSLDCSKIEQALALRLPAFSQCLGGLDG